MSASLDLKSLVHEIGPGFAEAADERDRDEIFVAENYDTLRAHKAFSALVPSELGGGGSTVDIVSEACRRADRRYDAAVDDALIHRTPCSGVNLPKRIETEKRFLRVSRNLQATPMLERE